MEFTNSYGFSLKDSHEYKDLGFTGYLFQDEKFKFPFLYLKSEEGTNYFSIHFRTMPEDNSGIPHMVEHLLLRGSEKYPINSLFDELKKRSFTDDLNALTTNNYTQFYFSSINQACFLSTLDIILDCVFHPKYQKTDFLIECHHFKFKDGDKNKPLLHGGVIYNEIIEEYSNIYEKIFETLYPDNPYKYFTGETPNNIPKATYEQTIKFHQKYYHPSNSFFFFFGNESFPVDLVFQKVHECIDKLSIIQLPNFDEIYQIKPWTEPKSITIDCQSDGKTSIETQNEIIIIFVINEKSSNDKLMCNLESLVEILGMIDNNYLEQSLVIPGHAKTAEMSISTDFYNPTITVTVSGFLKEKFTDIEKKIFETFQKFYDDNSEKADSKIESEIESMRHFYKLNNIHIDSDYGNSLFNVIGDQWTFGGDPLQLVDINTNLNNSAEDCKQKGYLRKLIKKYLIDNKHYVVARLNPVPDFEEKEIEKDQKNLEKMKKELTNDQIDEILNEMKLVSNEINKEKPIHLLPKFDRSTIPKEGSYYPIAENYKDTIYVINSATKGIIYSSIIIKCKNLYFPNLFLIKLMKKLSNSLGAGDLNDFEFSEYKLKWFMDCFVDIHVDINKNDSQDIELDFSCTALEEDIEKVHHILKIMTTQIHWNNIEKAKVVIDNYKNKLNYKLKNNLFEFNSIRAQANLNKSTAFYESIFGLTGYDKLFKYITSKSIKEILSDCENLYKQILTNGIFLCQITCSPKMNKNAISVYKDVIETIQKVPKIEFNQVDYSTDVLNSIKTKKTFILAPVQSGVVSFKKFCDLNKKFDYVYLNLLAHILTHEALEPLIREKCGVYIINASFSSGIFTILTQRDSTPTVSYEIIKKIIQNVESFINEETVENAVISSFTEIDRYKPPFLRGLSSIFDSKEETQEIRTAYRNASVEDVKSVAKYLINGEFNVSIVISQNMADPPDGFEIVDLNNYCSFTKEINDYVEEEEEEEEEKY